jgi:hypothetical protein
MAIWIVGLGLFSLFFGFMFIFSPSTLTKMNQGLNRMIQGVDTQAMKNRKAVGVVLVIVSIFFFYYASTLGSR